EARSEVLLDDVRATRDGDVALACRRQRLLQCGLDAARDEREGRPALLDQRLARMVGEDEHGHAERRLVAPPAVRVRVVLPRAGAAAEHLPAHHDRAGRLERLLDDLGVRCRLAALLTVAPAEAREAVEPFVQALAA